MYFLGRIEKMCKQIQNYINFLIVCLSVSNLCLAQLGCTDGEAYNCEDSMNGDYENYVGLTPYDYSCDGDVNHAGTEDCALGQICDGYYDPDATEDDGSCRYPQAPKGDDVVLTVEANGISGRWDDFSPPVPSEYYIVQRCPVGGTCLMLDDFQQEDHNTSTLFFDDYSYDEGVEIKYAIGVKYPNNPYWGWAIGASYITPCTTSGCGCTDEEAYNCEDSINGDYENYIGITPYDYSCDGDVNHAGTEDCALGQICDGYYDPDATEDDGSCRYPQAPGNNVVLAVEENGISGNWDTFVPPTKAHLWSYHVQRCVGESCIFLYENPPSHYNYYNMNTSPSFIDDNPYYEGQEIKYAISVKYSNNPYWGWAIGEKKITPPCSAASGDLNNDDQWNVQDIVILANCVLAPNCDTNCIDEETSEGIECYGCAGLISDDVGWNILDIVILANCILAGEDCSGRVDDATLSDLIMKDNMVSIEADGFIGGVQMTLQHGCWPQ